jgi:hypothetical protein
MSSTASAGGGGGGGAGAATAAASSSRSSSGSAGVAWLPMLRDILAGTIGGIGGKLIEYPCVAGACEPAARAARSRAPLNSAPLAPLAPAR